MLATDFKIPKMLCALNHVRSLYFLNLRIIYGPYEHKQWQ